MEPGALVEELGCMEMEVAEIWEEEGTSGEDGRWGRGRLEELDGGGGRDGGGVSD